MQPTPPSGSASFIASILKKLGKVVRSVARRRGVPFQDINEVSQRVSLDLVRYSDSIPRDGDLRPWLRVVTEHKVAEYFRDHPRHWVSLSTRRIDAKEQAPSAEEQLMAEQSRAVVRGEVERLAPEPRRVWKLRELEAMSFDEIAALEGVPFGTVSSRYLRATAQLTAALRRRARADARKRGDRSFAFVPLFWLYRDFAARARDAWRRLTGRARDAFTSLRDSLIERLRASRPELRFAILALCFVCSTVPWHDGPVLWDGLYGLAAVEGDIAGQSDGAIAQPVGTMPSSSPSSFISGDARPTGIALQAATVVLPSTGAPRPLAVDTARRDGGAALAPSPEARNRPFRDLALAHACLIRAQQAADEGRTEHAQQALRAYDAHAPDNPLAELRRSVTRTLDGHRAASGAAKDADRSAHDPAKGAGRAPQDTTKNKASQPAREEVAR